MTKKSNIPQYNIRQGDKGYPGVQESHERDPEGNPIADLSKFSENIFPSDAYDVMGGGVTEPSLDDAITSAPVEGHDNADGPVTDWHEQAAHLEIPWDEEYGYAGLGGKKLPDEPTDPEGDKRRLQEFAESSYKGVQLTRDVATASTFNTYTLSFTDLSPLPVLGANWARRRAIIHSMSTNTVNVLLGSQNVLGNSVGAGAYVLEPGRDLEVMNTDSVLAALITGAIAGAVITVMDEQYER